MTQRIVLFNGPPRCGKDTAARACLEAEDLNSYFRAFDRMSMPIKRAFAAMVGYNIDRWGNVNWWENNKEAPDKRLNGKTYRQWQIDFAEKFMKPLYGQDVFPRLFIDSIQRQHHNAVVFVPDCGFDVEYRVLEEMYPGHVLVVKIYRPGADFKGDSRSYLKVGTFGDKRDTEHVIHVNNAGTETEFKSKIVTRVGKWLNGEAK